MRIIPYVPPTVAPATPADLTDINAKIAALEAGEADDATVAALEAVRDAIPNISPLLDKLATPRDWVPGEDVKAGYQRYHYIHDTGLMVAPYTNFTRVQVLVESISDRKTGTTFDGPEAANWKYLSQNRVGSYLGGEVVVKGYRHRAPDKKLYEAVGNGGIRSTFLSTEWKEITPPPEINPWALLADLLPYAKTADIPAAQNWNDPVYDLLPSPNLSNSDIFGASTGTLAAGVAGSGLVCRGDVYTVAETAGSSPSGTWQVNFNLPGNFLSSIDLSLRFGIATTKTGTITMALDGVVTTLSGNGTKWTSSSPSTVPRTDGPWTWFETKIPRNGGVAVAVKVNMPPGQVLLPCFYGWGAITSRIPATPKAMNIIDPRTGLKLTYSLPAICIATGAGNGTTTPFTAAGDLRHVTVTSHNSGITHNAGIFTLVAGIYFLLLSERWIFTSSGTIARCAWTDEAGNNLLGTSEALSLPVTATSTEAYHAGAGVHQTSSPAAWGIFVTNSAINIKPRLTLANGSAQRETKAAIATIVMLQRF
jgi:hypothetical protein